MWKATSAFQITVSLSAQRQCGKRQCQELAAGGARQGKRCTDRLDIRGEGSLTGDVITHRISVEEGAILKGAVECERPESLTQKQESAKTMAATAP
jgi:cytoskeletal protein CcmA (bactofilin family)